MQFKHTMSTLIGLAAIALTAGCIPSLDPIYNEQDVVLRQQILGRWVNEEQSNSWVFSQHDDNAYELDYLGKTGRHATFVVHLTEIDDALFMDLFPVRSARTNPDFYDLHLVATHTFFRVDLAGDTLNLSFLNPQWLKQHRSEYPEVTLHTRGEHSVVLTADTATLRGFVAKLLDTDDAFTTPFKLTKTEGKLGT